MLQFANYLIREVMPVSKENTFNLKPPYDEYEFIVGHKKLFFHEISDIDLNKITFYKETDANAPKFVKERCMPFQPAIKYGYTE